MSDLALNSPVLLQGDNFTPLTRTPWAGTGIFKQFKQQLLPADATAAIGESWEFSADPNMPSHCPALGISLIELLAKEPVAVLGPKFAQAGCSLLLKLIATAEPLSFQLHPSDDDPNLMPGECGKPESWLIMHREPGAGIYLGFRPGLSRNHFANVLRSGVDIHDLMQFVPVEMGDFFDIPPHVPHAIGGGVTLLEPQRISPGLTGKTFRMWDWGRKYAADGHLDMVHGQKRPLHIEESLSLLDPEQQSGAAFLQNLRRTAMVRRVNACCDLLEYPNLQHYQVSRILWRGTVGHFRLNVPDAYALVFVAAGRIRWSQLPDAANFGKGQTILLPHAAMPIDFRFEAASDLIILTQGKTKFAVQVD